MRKPASENLLMKSCMICGCNVLKDLKRFKFASHKGNRNKDCINKFKHYNYLLGLQWKRKRVSKRKQKLLRPKAQVSHGRFLFVSMYALRICSSWSFFVSSNTFFLLELNWASKVSCYPLSWIQDFCNSLRSVGMSGWRMVWEKSISTTGSMITGRIAGYGIIRFWARACTHLR